MLGIGLGLGLGLCVSCGRTCLPLPRGQLMSGFSRALRLPPEDSREDDPRLPGAPGDAAPRRNGLMTNFLGVVGLAWIPGMV